MIFYSYLRKVFRVEIIDYSKIKKFQKVKQYNKERKTYAEKTKRKK